MADVRSEVRNYIIDTLLSGDSRGFADQTDLRESAILDSFATLELVQFIERTFQCSLGPEHIQPGSFRTVDSICAMVERARSGGPASTVDT
jgi:acyl carrier protein